MSYGLPTPTEVHPALHEAHPALSEALSGPPCSFQGQALLAPSEGRGRCPAKLRLRLNKSNGTEGTADHALFSFAGSNFPRSGYPPEWIPLPVWIYMLEAVLAFLHSFFAILILLPGRYAPRLFTPILSPVYCLLRRIREARYKQIFRCVLACL